MFRFTEPSSSQFLKTQYWYIQRVRTLWDPILLISGLVLELLSRNVILPGQLNSAEYLYMVSSTRIQLPQEKIFFGSNRL